MPVGRLLDLQDHLAQVAAGAKDLVGASGLGQREPADLVDLVADIPLLPAVLGVYEAQGIKNGAPSNKMKGPAFKTELATAYPDCLS